MVPKIKTVMIPTLKAGDHALKRMKKEEGKFLGLRTRGIKHGGHGVDRGPKKRTPSRRVDAKTVVKHLEKKINLYVWAI
jgi:hypothetical protein